MDEKELAKSIMKQLRSKKICCVNDMPGVGKIALSAMIPFLSVNGIEVASLPTALVSNTLDFGKFEDYSMPLISIWEHYMVYAVSFGIADKVEEQMRLHYKSMGEDKGYERYTSSSYMMRSRCYIYVRHSCYNSTQLANATIAQARSSSGSGGYGGGRSFGGGGGGHGGR